MKTLIAPIFCLALLGSSVAGQMQAPPPVAPPAGWTPTPTAISLQDGAFKRDSVTLVLAPREGMEYKYHLRQGAAMLFSWTATNAVHHEMHSEPEGGPKGFAETFDKHDAARGSHGSYVAPFTGIHGWYWENRSETPVTLTLASSGFFTESREFRRGQPVKVRPLN